MPRYRWILLSVLLVGLAPVAAEAGSPPLKPRAARQLEERLGALGYSSAVAARIAHREPALARRILAKKPRGGDVEQKVRTTDPVPLLNLGPMDGKPVRLYRGVAHDFDHYDLSFRDQRIPGVLFFSREVVEPHRYAWGDALGQRAAALANGEQFGTVIEVEVPGFHAYSYGHPVLRIADVPDLSIYIARVARVDLTRRYFPALHLTDLSWEQPDALLERGTR